MFFTRRKAEDLAEALELLDRVTGRVAKLETIPRPTPDLTALREGQQVVTAAIADLRERADQATAEMNELRDGYKDLVLAVAEGIERTERAERRVKAVVKRARKELAESGLTDPALESEDRELSPLDGDGGGNGELPALPAPVARAAPQASSIRGVPVDVLRRVRGF